MTTTGQLALDLKLANAETLEYFVVHSGVVAAVRLLESAVEDAPTRRNFRQIVVEGRAGTGKSHLLRALLHRGRELGLDEAALEICDLNAELEARSPEEAVSWFISRYEAARKRGALFLVEIDRPAPALEPGLREHLYSRLRAGEVVEMDLPAENEVRAVVSSVMERMNLRLPDAALALLETRLPRNPRSFTELLRIVDDVSLREGRRIGRQLVGRVLRERSAEERGISESSDGITSD